ncbi:mitochondrial ribosomal protein L37 [Carabus blaptoides fortunei]
MKITRILCRQHIDRMFKAHWRVQGKRVPIDTKAEKVLAAKGVPVYNPQDVIREKRQKLKVDIVGYIPKPVRKDETHPNWHENVCYFYRDNNVLLEGIDQAKIITKTIELQSGLPEIIENAPKPSKEINNRALRIIMSSHLFDTQQEKLPKIKDPERPAYNFPRVLGITNERVNFLLTSKLLQLCENSSDKSLAKDRTVFNNAKFFVPLKKSEDLLQLELSADKLLMSSKPLEILTTHSTDNIDLPNLFPIKHTITLVPEHIYETNNVYPIKKTSLKCHPHTVFVHYDHTKVANLFEEEVTEAQVLGRSLMKTFAVAAAYARQKYGNDVQVLPQPVTLQCVQTDGKQFHFAMLQLNTLDLQDGGVKNVWYSVPNMPLFQTCEYQVGKPVVLGYNQDVMKYLLAFYNNV